MSLLLHRRCISSSLTLKVWLTPAEVSALRAAVMSALHQRLLRLMTSSSPAEDGPPTARFIMLGGFERTFSALLFLRMGFRAPGWAQLFSQWYRWCRVQLWKNNTDLSDALKDNNLPIQVSTPWTMRIMCEALSSPVEVNQRQLHEHMLVLGTSSHSSGVFSFHSTLRCVQTLTLFCLYYHSSVS